MRTTMSFTSRRELLTKVVPRYREATRKQKTFILNEFIASTWTSPSIVDIPKSLT